MDDLSELIREYVNLSDTIADYEARPQNNMELQEKVTHLRMMIGFYQRKIEILNEIRPANMARIEDVIRNPKRDSPGVRRLKALWRSWTITSVSMTNIGGIAGLYLAHQIAGWGAIGVVLIFYVVTFFLILYDKV